MIFWLVLKVEVSYRIIIYLEGFGFLLEDILKIIFWHVFVILPQLVF
jgi:hypothetical protein